MGMCGGLKVGMKGSSMMGVKSKDLELKYMAMSSDTEMTALLSGNLNRRTVGIFSNPGKQLNIVSATVGRLSSEVFISRHRVDPSAWSFDSISTFIRVYVNTERMEDWYLYIYCNPATDRKHIVESVLRNLKNIVRRKEYAPKKPIMDNITADRAPVVRINRSFP